MTTPFPLFSLPFIPLKRVLDNFGPHGIIILSLCSQRSKSIAVSYSGPSKNVQLQLIYGNNIGSLAYDLTYIWESVDINELEDLRLPRLLNGRFRGFQYEMDGDCLVTYWEDRVAGLIEIGNYAREIFNRDIYHICVISKDADVYKRLIEWTMATQKSIEYFQCNTDEETLDEDLDYILENVKCTGSLSLSAKPPKNYRPAKPPVFNLDVIFILNSFWIKPKDLFGMNCKSVILRDSKLTSQDLNVFLKHWMAGECFNLKDFMCLNVEEAIDYEVALDGVEFIKRDDDVERRYHYDDEGNPTRITGGFDIKRPSDNITVTIENGDEDCFRMVVWPDFAGNAYY